ncbi:MAG: DUF5667 domain-containing protein [Chloroflexota bacterium]
MNEQERLDRAKNALERLSSAPAPDPLREASARRRFLEQAARLRTGVRAARQTNRGRLTIWLRGGIAISLIVLALGAMTGVASAADYAVPGDLLYPLDLSIEELRLSLARHPEDLVALLLAFADERLQEVEQLNSPETEQQMEIALEAYEQTLIDLALVLDSAEETDQQALTEMRAQALSVHEQRLLVVRQEAPEQAWPGLDRAIEASQKGRDGGRGNNDPEKTPGPPEDKPGNSSPGQPEKTPGPPEGVPNESSHKTKTPGKP